MPRPPSRALRNGCFGFFCPFLRSWPWLARLILSIYGPAFRQGAIWLDIVALACAHERFVGLAETVIMVQRPRLNLLNSAITGRDCGGCELLADQVA